MTPERPPFVLSFFQDKVGHDLAAWRHPEAATETVLTLEYQARLARTAERGKFDMVFLADALTLLPENNSAFTTTFYFEPLVLLATLAAATKRIGLAATVSTSYGEPYHVARAFGTLDLLSGGRGAWNVVTSMRESEAWNFGREGSLDHATRYERAQEFLDVVRLLWRSWEPDAIVADRASGRFADPDKIHPIRHRGRHFAVEGPLNVPRSPQGEPVIVQAGASSIGKAFAARNAEVIFASTPDLRSARAFYADVKEAAVAEGRRPEAIKILPGMIPIVGRTRAEAEEKHRFLKGLLLPEAAIRYLSQWLETDLSGFDPDRPLPDIFDIERIRGQKGRFANIIDISRREKLTLGALAARVAATRTHCFMVGTAEEIADEMEAWLDGGGCDGFNILTTHLPAGLDEFVDEVVPLLQERGRFRADYEHETLRGHLGLPFDEASLERRGVSEAPRYHARLTETASA
ncbi:LLM class flavin-dependent oxidoreductase [Enterovirga aerilata]|uniref:LLM class flavin-dependent oxidoreductase n=1 Tax=Enterovirga aerilata TaxID=2730920 RepID=A0A849I700_9HYPH|nr:LLM class flavin-dependent oxidoreductase [Enterovirga sp. DB1703]NNM73158.1 LLM class flavin-dependent oxidoreductase [Enterovirga sp. DB1703]